MVLKLFGLHFLGLIYEPNHQMCDIYMLFAKQLIGKTLFLALGLL